MGFVEKVERNGRVYYYACKNFRTGISKWKKVRRYLGSESPSKRALKEAFKDIDEEAREKGLGHRSKFKYLDEEAAERLEDVKVTFKKHYDSLPLSARRKYDEDFLIRFTYNTNAIEGNRLTLRETALILEKGYFPPGSDQNDIAEALNSKDAYDYVREYKRGLNRTFVLRLHRDVTKGTKCRLVGEFRDCQVRISGSDWVPPNPMAVPHRMKDLFVWYNNNKRRLHPVELGAVAHLKFVQIHPFVDGNGRTARLIMNWILHRAGYPMFLIENKKKLAYYDAIEAGDEGDHTTFVRYVARRIIEQFTFVLKR